MKITQSGIYLFNTFVLLSCLVSCQKAEEVKKTSKPNIVVIFADDMGYGDLGVYGATEWKTPNLDQLAADGVRFTQFYVPHAVCSASRAALLTGTYANRLEIFGALDHTAKHGLNPEETTIAEMLKSDGYATGMVGKWHLGHMPEFLPTEQGFDSYYGLPYSNDMWPHHPESKNYYPPLPLYRNIAVIDTLDDQSQLTTNYTEEALKFIENSKDKPFFLYFAHSMPHVPLFVSDKFKGKSTQGLYGDVMMEIDWSVGEVRKKLKELELDENTIIIFTSDNGPWLSYGGQAGLTGGLKEGKGTSWEGGIREPGIFVWPGHFPAGKVIDEAAMTIDILPTLAEITGASLPGLKVDGRSILPLLEGKEMDDKAYFAYYNRNELQAVIYGQWKLVFPHKYRTIPIDAKLTNDGIPVIYQMVELETPQLFDLSKDPNETTDVSENNPEILTKMHQLADEGRADMGDALTNSEGTGLRKHGRIE
ncbi:arylsulfatase A-like enzyme [Algoriphagus ratkowskyi]|uniref:Sulfatase n=1 Tax=Algoriphagus ratkowskyi TaxID=57028 RepID=A0A2W7TD80_9BACT|nr:sulfatase [Algoriphagus ratkowskyi]PZX61262.1 arylsulfatase A-like enzyme [Algoriphagus ratkowskyi]TXD79377.1 sulfatase [Algoriphagus ratkowskyi]